MWNKQNPRKTYRLRKHLHRKQRKVQMLRTASFVSDPFGRHLPKYRRSTRGTNGHRPLPLKWTKKQLQIRKKHYNNFRQYFYRRRVFSSCDQSSQIGNQPISVDDGLRSCFCRSTSPESYGQTVWKVHLRIHGGRIIMHRPPPPWWNGIPLSKLQTKVCPTSMGWLSLSNDRDQYCRGAVWHCRGVYGS